MALNKSLKNLHDYRCEGHWSIVIQARGFIVLRHRDDDGFFKGGGNHRGSKVVFYIIFFVINNFLFLFFHKQHNIQNKTKQNSRHILNISRFNQKGGREERTTRTQKLLL